MNELTLVTAKYMDKTFSFRNITMFRPARASHEEVPLLSAFAPTACSAPAKIQQPAHQLTRNKLPLTSNNTEQANADPTLSLDDKLEVNKKQVLCP